MPPLTRGPLPAGTYWRRRIFVLGLAASLVFVIVNMIGSGDDQDSPVAQQAAAPVEPTATVDPDGSGDRADADEEQSGTEQDEAEPQDKRKKNKKNKNQGRKDREEQPLAEPEGNCHPADIRVAPKVRSTPAGDPVTIGLRLRTQDAEACYWRIGPDKVSVKIVDGSTEIWASRQCPDMVPRDSVVVRSAVPTVVEMTWDGRESDATCSKRRSWVRWGDFTITAAALGGEPTESTFDLTKPTPETTITN